MELKEVRISFDALHDTVGEAMLTFAREKAAMANSTIVYQENNVMIEENPITGKKKVLQYFHTEL